MLAVMPIVHNRGDDEHVTVAGDDERRKKLLFPSSFSSSPPAPPRVSPAPPSQQPPPAPTSLHLLQVRRHRLPESMGSTVRQFRPTRVPKKCRFFCAREQTVLPHPQDQRMMLQNPDRNENLENPPEELPTNCSRIRCVSLCLGRNRENLKAHERGYQPLSNC